MTVLTVIASALAFVEISTHSLASRRFCDRGSVPGAVAGACFTYQTVIELTVDDGPNDGVILTQEDALPHESGVIIPDGFKFVCD